ncbi:MAG: MoaD/ThiS family protein [Gemmatimonadota bacterium]
MNLDVLLFASYADAIGAPAVRVSVPDDARVADVVLAVRALSAGATLPERPLVAVNHRYAKPDQLVKPTDEVALIPPVAGG